MRAFKIHMGRMASRLSEGDIRTLMERTEGFSGSDISNVVQDALMMPMKKVTIATHYRQVLHHGVEKWTPCSPNDPDAIAMSWKQVPSKKMLEPPVQAADVLAVLKKFKSSVGHQDVEKCQAWTEEFGSEGA